MSKTAVVRARIEPDLKENAERILSEVGLTPSTAVGILYRHIVREKGFPISLKVPNATTRAALDDAMHRTESERGEEYLRYPRGRR